MSNDRNQEYPFARANGNQRSDQESGTSSTDLKRQKRIRLAIYIAAFVVFQVIVITVFGLTVMKVKSPKLRLANIEFQSLTTSTATSPSFDMTFAAQVRVKNTNFGRYKFDNTTATFTYGGSPVGQVTILKGKAGMRSTKKMNVVVSLSSDRLASNANLGDDLRAGTLMLSATAKMTGKVELMFVMKKKKSANMNCTITVDVQAKAIKTLQCK